MLASVSINGSACTYSYSSHLKKLLYSPSMYGRVDMAVQAKFKSSYALALYENCIRYQNLPYSGWFTMEVFRKLMGVGTDKYSVFRDFKRRIIDKAAEEVNAYSDLTVTPEMKRLQRKVVSIRFKIESKKVEVIDVANDLQTYLINEWGIPSPKALEIITSYSEQYIKDKVSIIVNSKSFKAKKIKSKSAYLMKALIDNYQESSKFGATIAVSKKYKDFKVEHAENLKPTHSEVIYDDLCKYLDNKNQKKNIILKFEDFLSKNHAIFLWKYYTKDGLSHRAVRAEFVQYIRQSHNDVYMGFCDAEKINCSKDAV